jgi:HTH-type transcriptional regulator/antitoxin HigA
VDPYVLFAWQRLCEKETESIIINTGLDKERLKNRLQDIKKMMFGDINNGIQELQRVFAECGIAFQVVKNFRGAPVQGFIKETGDHRLILCLTIRGKRADRFWFTLFHEIAHILNGDYKIRFVDFDSVQNEVESRADSFAGDVLIDPQLYRQFVHTNRYPSWSDIEELAFMAQVQPFIVLGRLQKDDVLEWSDYSEKVVYYKWAA